MADEATLAAGTIVEYATDLATPVYDKIIAGVLSFGAVGEMAVAKDSTTLADTVKKSGAGMKETPDKSIKGQHWALDAGQQSFLAAAKNADTILVRVTYPTPVGGLTGAIVTMELKLLGFELDDVSGEDWMMFTVNAKQNSFDLVDATPTV